MNEQSVTPRKRWRYRSEWLLLAGTIVILFIGLEGASRIWVAVRWTERRQSALLDRPGAVAGYVFHPETGYALQPDLVRKGIRGQFSHNHLGFRSLREFTPKPAAGVVRIAMIGASTVYGIYVDDTETSAVRLEEWITRKHPGLTVEIINAGVPGWTTRETLIGLQRVLDLEPHIIVVMDGRNDVFPALFDNYRDDYSHYRRIGYDYRAGNRVYKSIFRVSYFAMLLVTTRAERLGYKRVNENPAYGYLRWENRPTPDVIARNGQDTTRTRGFQSNLEAIVQRSQSQGARVVLASMPFLTEKFASGVFLRDHDVLPVVERFIGINNNITRSVAAKWGLPFVDGASLTRPDLLFDDCHFRPVGEVALAELLGQAIESLLPALTAR